MAMRRISGDRRRLLPLLLMGDEQESLVERYLDRCGLYVWEEAGEVLAVCAAERTGSGTVELLNLAVAPEHRRRGIGRELLLAVCGGVPGLRRGAGHRRDAGDPGLLPGLRLPGDRKSGKTISRSITTTPSWRRA